MCVVSQGTFQTFVDFYVGHFSIVLSKNIRFSLCIARIQMLGVKLILKKEFMERRKLQNMCLIYLYIYIIHI